MRALAAALLAAGAMTGEESGFSIESPGAILGADGVVAVRGAVARLDGRQLLADALRYDPAGDAVWASGNVVLRLPGVRIAAARLGAHPRQRRGDAWEVEAVVASRERVITVRAERAEWRGDEVVFHGVSADFGHGGIVSFSMPRLRVLLRPSRDAGRSGPGEWAEGIELISPTGRVVGMPVIWLPWMYRDFTVDYPWTRVRFGSTRRLGTFLRYWIGTDLPAIGGWRTGITGRVDLNSIAGGGGGLGAHWRNGTWGAGEGWWFTQPAEKVRGGEDQREELAVRQATYLDAEHRAPIAAGPGAGAFYGRFVRTPPPDPAADGVDADADGLRWMSDYFPERLDNAPYPGRSAAVAYGIGAGTVVVDTSRSHQDDLHASERWHGIQAVLPPWQVLGPLHLSASAWEEDLHRTYADTSANRFTWLARAGASRWWGGWGADASGGLRGLSYYDGTIAGVEQETWQQRRQGVADGGVSLRLVERGGTWTHVITPRLGVQILGPGAGDALADYGFGDPRDALEEDRRYGTAGFTTSLSSGQPVFRAEFLSRWALREEDRRYTAADGSTGMGDGRLVDLAGTAEGTLWKEVSLVGSFRYDARQSQWENVNAGLTWHAAPWIEPRYDVTLVDAEDGTRTIDHGPGGAVTANRYRLEGRLGFSPTGAALDRWRIMLTRRMVDGDLAIGYEMIHDPASGVLVDRRVTIGFSLAADHPEATRAYSRAF